MAHATAQLFEDELPLIRSCPTLNEIRISEEIRDLTIEVKYGGRLYVHRIIIAARIPSLRATLSGPRTEENSVLRWPTVPLSVATSLINYVYTGQVEITQAQLRGMVALARTVRLRDLENWGVDFMACSVTLDTLAPTWDFAKCLKLKSLMDICLELMQTQFSNFICSDLFARLPPETLLTLLRNDDQAVNSEEEVFAAISCWVGPGKEDINERLKLHAPTMLKEVRWLQTTGPFRNRLMENDPMFQHSLGCARLLGLVEQYIGAAPNNKPSCPFKLQRRRLPTVFLVFGQDKNQSKWSVLSFDSEMQNEERIADMKYRQYASYCVVDESVFVVGGRTAQQSYSRCVDEFVLGERCWHKRAPLAVGRWMHTATVLRVDSAVAAAAAADVKAGGGKTLLSVFGGYNGASLSSCEVYDVTQDRWYKLPDLRKKRYGPAAACLPCDSRVFVFGGYGVSSRLASVEFCQLGADWQTRATAANTADFWLPAAPMRTARSALAATPFHGRILVAGGFGGEKVVEMFSLPDASSPRGQWTELAVMQQPHRYFTLLTTADAVFALGDNYASRNTVETLTKPEGSANSGDDLTSWRWSSKDPVETLSRIWGAASIRM